MGPTVSQLFHAAARLFVANADGDETWRWLKKQDFHSRWMPEGMRWLPYVFAGEYPWAVQVQGMLAEAREGDYGSRARGLPRRMVPAALDQALEFEFDEYHGGTTGLILPHPCFFDGTDLRWDGCAGYHDHAARPVFLSPELLESGPHALLVDRTWLESWLAERDLALMWTVLSEKHWHTGDLGAHGLGYAVYSRAYRLTADRIVAGKAIARRVRPK